MGESHTATSGDIRQQVLLGERKLGTKTIFNRIDFVDVVLNLQIFSAVSDITELDHRVTSELTLITDAP